MIKITERRRRWIITFNWRSIIKSARISWCIHSLTISFDFRCERMMCKKVLLRKANDQRGKRAERALQNKKKKREKLLIIYKVTTMKNLSYYIKLLCNNCPYILKCQNKLIMKKKGKVFVFVCLDHNVFSRISRELWTKSDLLIVHYIHYETKRLIIVIFVWFRAFFMI